MIGKTIGKYRFVDRLGKGGMGAVYRAIDETLDREVAVKVLHPELSDPSLMARFRAEATTLAKLNHPEIATIYEIYPADSDLLMVMELVRGETLDHLSQRCGPLPPQRAAYLVAQVLGALGHAHRAGIVHRDLKPANVMVTESGGVKIMDFGIARVVGAEHLTTDGMMMGTPAYMAPEQVMAKDVDVRADLYSAGVVLYRLLTGTLPYQADTAVGMVQKQLSDPPTPVRSRRADLPEWCETIISRALAKSPADRFQTADEFRAALLAAMGETEHTGAFAAAHLQATAIPTPLPTPVRTPIAGAPVPGFVTATPPPPAPVAPAATADPGTIIVKKSQFAIAGTLLAAIAIGAAVLALVAIRRSTAPAAPATAAANAAPATASAPEERAPDVTPPPAPPTPTATPATPAPAAHAPASTAASGDELPRATTGSAAAKATTTPAVRPASAAVREPAAVPAASSSGTAAGRAAAAAVTSAPPFAFEAKAVVVEGGKNKEHDTNVLLDGSGLTVAEKNKAVVTAMPFASVVGMSYSNSKQPMWKTEQGPAEVVHVDGGAFGFLKGGRNWLTVRTNETSLVLRVRDEQLSHVMSELEQRTGHKIERVADGKDR